MSLPSPAPGTCATCPFRQDLGARGLRCRERSPSAEPITSVAAWPVVKPNDACGRHPDFVPAPPVRHDGQGSLPL